jgi:hypothetical protein
MKLVVLAAIGSLAAGAAQAGTAEALRAAVYRGPQPTSAVASTIVLPALDTAPSRPAGVAKTSIDHSFARRGLDGSLGFLCGLQPKPDNDGAAGAYGVDPQGRFVGVKLHMSVR